MKPLAMDFSDFRELPEDTVAQIGSKAARYSNLQKTQAFAQASLAADLYIAAFLLPKNSGATASAATRNVPTTEDVWLAFDKGTISQSLTNAPKAAHQARAFHWPLEFPDVMVSGGFDVVLGNPPWEKYTILEREFFSDLPDISGEPNAALRRKLIKSVLESSKELSAKWEYAQREAKAKGEFVRKSNRFPKAGVGELNLYPLFAELACSAVSHKGIVGIVLKSMMFTGSTWKGFTDQLITSGRLYSVFDFKNWEMLFSSVGFHERFSLVTIGTPKPNSNIELSVGLTNPSQLGEQGSIICVDRQFPRQVNPNTGTLPQCETARDIQILSRIAGKFPTLGQSDWNARYTTGLHMTGDAAELHDREKLEHSGYELHGSWFIGADECFAPVYEGKLIHQYDHRFATFDGIPREKRFGIKAPTNVPSEIDKADRDFELVPRYWISRTFYEENTRRRKINENWNIAFRDTTNVISNFRTAVGCIVGPAAYSYKCPNIVIDDGVPVSSALFLSLFNSVPYDYLLRQKFYGANLTKSMLMQAFVVSQSQVSIFEDKLLDAVAKLTNTSKSVSGFCAAIDRESHTITEPYERLELCAWIDSVYFKLFEFNRDEVTYVFDTFPIWKDKSIETHGRFIEQEITLKFFDRFESLNGF